ncbi:MAG: BrxE family protein [Anaerolineaceae bacterium]|nr:BrxE family protein [Anaerolineaceae bacterium]
MTTDLLSVIANLRIYVGYLGEKDQYGWWKSSFFTTSSDAFLSPLFSRTKILAQVNGVTRAASILHDEHIGVGHVYHLFRLPEELEQRLHQELKDPKTTSTIPNTLTEDIAIKHLEVFSTLYEKDDIGPVRIGSISDLYKIEAWRIVTGSYLQAFYNQKQIYPYFS